MARARKHDISSICVEMDEMNEGALWLERLALVVHGVFASTQADSRRAAEPITGCSRNSHTYQQYTTFINPHCNQIYLVTLTYRRAKDKTEQGGTTAPFRGPLSAFRNS
jgi:hypothetical protein